MLSQVMNPCMSNPCGANAICNLNVPLCGYTCVPSMRYFSLISFRNKKTVI